MVLRDEGDADGLARPRRKSNVFAWLYSLGRGYYGMTNKCLDSFSDALGHDHEARGFRGCNTGHLFHALHLNLISRTPLR